MKRALHILLWAALLLSPSWALAWDPNRIAEVKSRAERAYDAGEYPEAARHYIELRGLLKDAIDGGTVPPEFEGSARAALHAVTYQLGRSNQLSANCSGAEQVYKDLLEDDLTDGLLKARSRHRLTETYLCLADERLVGSDYDAAATLHEDARQELAVLRSQLEDPELSGQLDTELESLETMIDQSRVRALDALADETSQALTRERCEPARRSLDVAQQRFDASNDPGRWPELESWYDRTCNNPVAKGDPVPTEDETGLNVWPWIVTGIGGAIIVGAVTLDAVTSSDIDEYEDILATCRAGVVARCGDARSRYDDIAVRQDVVLALYITGGIVFAGGLVWGIVDLTSGGSDDAGPQVSVAPTGDGFVSTVHWRF